jgi:mono/diheme cytochrome c family protein
MSRPISRLALVLFVVLLSFAASSAQQTQTPQKMTATPYSAIPAEAAKQANPVKSSPESLERARKWWAMDCAMCHGKDGDGKGEVATSEKLTIADFTNSAALKDHSDGEIFYIIKNGHQDMPPEGERIKAEDGWDLVNYVRSLAKRKADTAQKP